MSDAIVSITPQLRRYAHAALGCWPPAPRRPGETRPRVDQDADDLVHDALLDCWRAGARRQGDAGADDALRLALYARVTALARLHVARNAAQSLAASGQDDVAEAPAAPMTHIPWAPELAALPRLALDLRALLALVTLERLTYAQAGAVLDMAEDQVLARLTVARARFASEIAGVVRTHLFVVAGGEQALAVAAGDLHRFVDDRLAPDRRREIAAILDAQPHAARHANEWRRQSERLRQAFGPLMRAPLPLSLDFATLDPRVWPHWSGGGARPGVFKRLAALFAPPEGRVGVASRPL